MTNPKTSPVAESVVELKPCPHCGLGQSMCEPVQDIDASKRWQVYCGRCGSSTGAYTTRAGAISLWNTRPIEDDTPTVAGEGAQLAQIIETRLLGVDPADQDVVLEDDDWRRILAALRTPSPSAEPVAWDEREGCVGPMNTERATYFLQRFKRDEKMLGPHEQWALDYAMAALASSPATEKQIGALAVEPFTKDEFADLWDDVVEADDRLVNDSQAFYEACEKAGLAEFIPVDDKSLDDAFAYERGIEAGGMMWALTREGQRRYMSCRAAMAPEQSS